MRRTNPFFTDFPSVLQWTRAALHEWLATCRPRYVIDINRDTQLQDAYADTPHSLVRGVARIAGTDDRFVIHHYDGERYRSIEQSEVNTALPVLFKPMGSPVPEAAHIASDADYVDYITELMGSFAIPEFLKTYRRHERYLVIGLRMLRDTERRVLSDLIYGAGDPPAWALIPDPTNKQQRFCRHQGIQILAADVTDLLAAAGFGSKAASERGHCVGPARSNRLI